MSVNLVAGRVKKRAAGTMAAEHELGTEVRETEFADVQDREMGIFLGVRAEVPRLNLMLAHLDPVQILDPGYLGYRLCH